MLTGVLLHVIIAALPGYFTLDGGFGQRGSEDVDDGFTFVDYVENRNVVEGAEVMRLAAGGGIKSGLIEANTEKIVTGGGDSRLCLRDVAVGVIEAFG